MVYVFFSDRALLQSKLHPMSPKIPFTPYDDIIMYLCNISTCYFPAQFTTSIYHIVFHMRRR